jgi:phosphoribosylaminoimidazole (AIR) synthetase
MYRTFNMGIGLVIALKEVEAKKLMVSPLECTIIGEVVTGEGVVYL